MNFILLLFHYNCLRSLTGYLPSHPSNRREARYRLLTIRCSGNEPALLPLKIRLAPIRSLSAKIEQAALCYSKGGLRYGIKSLPYLTCNLVSLIFIRRVVIYPLDSAIQRLKTFWTIGTWSRLQTADG